MKTNQTIAMAMILSLAVLWCIVGFMVGNRLSGHRIEVQQVCDRSRSIYDGKAEEKCGSLQDEYGIEYLCTSNTARAYCWTEVK